MGIFQGFGHIVQMHLFQNIPASDQKLSVHNQSIGFLLSIFTFSDWNPISIYKFSTHFDFSHHTSFSPLQSYQHLEKGFKRVQDFRRRNHQNCLLTQLCRRTAWFTWWTASLCCSPFSSAGSCSSPTFTTGNTSFHVKSTTNAMHIYVILHYVSHISVES